MFGTQLIKLLQNVKLFISVLLVSPTKQICNFQISRASLLYSIVFFFFVVTQNSPLLQSSGADDIFIITVVIVKKKQTH
jgi:hypothetical protein